LQDSSGTNRPFISVEGLTKTFGQLVALDEVDFGIAAGEVHALLGENGAGKTTLCNILAGIYQADSGEVYLDGSPVSFHSPADAIAGGIGMVHQHFKLVPTMTVAQNLHMGWQETPRVFTNAELNQRSAAIIEEFNLPVDPTAKIFELSVGEQQRVEIVRTLARGAKLLILDEPTAVLTSQEATELFDVLRELVATGRSVIFISHKLREVLAVADRITVLRNGKRMTTIDVAAATVDKLAQLMTGSNQPIGQVARSGTVDAGKVILEATGVEALSSRGLVALKGVDLTVRSGEIVGVAGVSGNGQTELAELIVGVRPLTAGSIKIADDDGGMSPPSPGQRGIGSIPEDRMGHGLVGAASTLRNAVIREYRTRELSDGLWLKWAGIRDYAARVVREGRVQVRDMAASVGQLSGGNQQRLLAKREALVADRFLLAVHPTRGLDIQAALEVQQTLEERRAAGVGVLLISDDLGEVLAMSDRIVVMYDGEIVGESERGQFDRDKIGLQMGGHYEAAAAS
jgi:simple sugar transport system ATP-binding protein